MHARCYGWLTEETTSPRYYGSSVLDSIHRGIAVETWSRYQGAPLSTRGLDRALGAFDMSRCSTISRRISITYVKRLSAAPNLFPPFPLNLRGQY